MDNFREWLSDNLRYILLILGIAAVVVGLFFGIRALSALTGGSGAENSDTLVEASSETEEESEEEAPALTATPTPTPTETPTPTPTETPTPTPTPEPLGGNLQQDANEAVTQTVTTYYSALENKDAALLATVVDNVSEEEAAQIAESSQTTYSDISVYTKYGLTDDSYVAYAYYHYLPDGALVAKPGLTQLYMKLSEDGSYRIISEMDAETQSYIDSINSAEDVTALTAEVETEAAEAETAEAEAQAAAQAEAEAQAQAEAEAAAAAQAAAEAEAAAQAEAERLAAEQAAWEAAHKETPATINSTCNVRSGNGYEYEVIYPDLPTGTSITVIGEKQDGWYHIKTDFVEGYVGWHFVTF